MNINLKSLVLGTSLSLIPNLTNAQCVATQDCASLGYTETSCPDGKGLKCPFGNTFACPMSEVTFCEKYGFKHTCSGEGDEAGSGQICNGKYAFCSCADGYEWKNDKCQKKQTPGKAVLGQCNGYAKNCQLGWLLNSDGTCTENKVSGKTPIGVIVYLSLRGCGQAVSEKQVASGVQWAVDLNAGPGIIRGDHEAAYGDFDGYENTLRIIQLGDSNVFPAAWAAVNYIPAKAPETKGKWFLPSSGVLHEIYLNLGKINEGIKRIGGETLGDRICSSTEERTSFIWAFSMYSTGGLYNYRKHETFIVRPVIEF